MTVLRPLSPVLRAAVLALLAVSAWPALAAGGPAAVPGATPAAAPAAVLGDGPEAQAAALCAAARSGEQCGPGHGRRTPGGGEKVSHKGWPAVTGVLWKAIGNHGSVMRGGPRNDELLGHHGDDRLNGGAGRDILWGDWDPVGNTTRQRDVLDGGPGNDWLYSSHGRNTIRGGTGNDYVWAYYGHGTIDCGPGFDTLRVRLVNRYRWRNCERIKNFCAFGSKPGNKGGCYKPGERPRGRR
jgi:Ca2+-binding RTX toxin-like protein